MTDILILIPGYRPCLPVVQKAAPAQGKESTLGYENFNSSLIRIGLLGSSPLLPKTAFSIKSLETYRQLRLNKPSLSIQAFTQALCATSSIKYTVGLRNRLNDSFDVYLAILRRVDHMITIALGMNIPHWRVRNTCPCCNHRVSDEPRLEFDQIFSIDGGCSLKRLQDAGSADNRTFDGDYLVKRDAVDLFKYEAVKKTVEKARRGKKTSGGDGAGEDKEQANDVALELGEVSREIDGEGVEWVTKNVQAEPGLEESNEKSNELTLCVKRWKANADDDKKGMFSCFDEAGIFIAVCRHGFLLAYCDIVQSGEL